MQDPRQQITYRQGLSFGLLDAMGLDPAIVCLGVGVADDKGIFGTTREARDRFPDRVIETPLSENALTGMLLGMALGGMKPMLIHARMDFLMLTMEHLVNTLAKWPFLHPDQAVPTVVIRAVVGRGRGQGPTHSQNLSAMLAHVPGLQVLMPYRPCDAYYATRWAFQEPGVKVLVDYRRLYDDTWDKLGRTSGMVFWGQGNAAGYTHARKCAVSIVGFGDALRECHLAAQWLWSYYDLTVYIYDPQSTPMDEGGIVGAINATGRVVVVSTDWASCGLAPEVCSIAARHCDMKARPVIVTPPATPCPASPHGEAEWYPSVNDILKACYKVCGIDNPTYPDGQEQRSPALSGGGPF